MLLPAVALVKIETQYVFLPTLIKTFYCHLQFFKEANETYVKLQKEHETIRSKYICDKNTPMDNLCELLKNLEVSLYSI